MRCSSPLLALSRLEGWGGRMPSSQWRLCLSNERKWKCKQMLKAVARAKEAGDAYGGSLFDVDESFALLNQPTLLINDSLVLNDAALERLVRFLVAEESMLFAEDSLFTEQLASPPDRKSSYHSRALSARSSLLQAQPRLNEVAERRDGRRARVEAEQQDMLRILRPLGLQTAPADSGMTPGQVLMAEMLATLERMSAPAREAAEEAGVWWRDPGHASDVVDGSKYSVDAWGRRRGASKRGCCAWYRWSLSSVPVRMRAQLSTNCLSGAEHHSEMFVCWWCGGPALAHEDLGPASDKEEIGFFQALDRGERLGGSLSWDWMPCSRRT
ncbi:unnamed protein product [Polarella glacialis]|uniref:Uncharacterized protein n=1 Tax=Polarella glacialis TaxID=89957 RepID=A0A813G4Y2_POLGL|nr:unnamed protein product [Polarella glacialis]